MRYYHAINRDDSVPLMSVIISHGPAKGGGGEEEERKNGDVVTVARKFPEQTFFVGAISENADDELPASRSKSEERTLKNAGHRDLSSYNIISVDV